MYEAGQVGIRIENELECYHKADNQYGTFLAFPSADLCAHCHLSCGARCPDPGRAGLAERLPPRSV